MRRYINFYRVSAPMSLATTFPISPLFWPTVCSLACDSVCLCVPLIVDLICFCCLWRRPTCPAARKTHPPDHCSPGPWLPSTPLKTNCRTGQEKQKSSPCAPNESDSTKRCHLASWNEHSPRIVVVFHKKIFRNSGFKDPEQSRGLFLT